MDKKYIVYKVTNKLDNKFYVGVHVCTKPNDKYMGSGTEIRQAIKEYGKKNFVKDILFEFENKIDMLSKEREIVTKEFCMRQDTYNRIEGGSGFNTENMVAVKDARGNRSIVYKTDYRYITGELIANNTGLIFKKDIVTVKDKNNNCYRVHKQDPRVLNGELISIFKGTVTVKDKYGNTSRVNCDDPMYLSGELIPIGKNKVVVKNKEGKLLRIDKDDPRYQSGELVYFHKGKMGKSGMEGKQHSKDTKIKMAEAKKGNKNGLGYKHDIEDVKKRKEKRQCEFYVYNLDGKFISKNKGIIEYAKKNGFSHGNIVAVLQGKAKQTKGFRFYYEFKGEQINE